MAIYETTDMLSKIIHNLLIEKEINKLEKEIQNLKRKQHRGMSCQVDFKWQVNTTNGWISYDELTNVQLEILKNKGISDEITYKYNETPYIINIRTMRQTRRSNTSLFRTIRRKKRLSSS